MVSPLRALLKKKQPKEWKLTDSPVKKKQPKEWKLTDSPVKKKLLAQRPVKKVILSAGSEKGTAAFDFLG